MALSFTRVYQTSGDSISKKPESARLALIIFAGPRVRVSCYLLQIGFIRRTEVQIRPDLLHTVFPQVANTTNKPSIGLKGLAMLLKCKRIEPLTVCSVAATASEIILCESVVSSNNGALRTVNHRHRQRYEKLFKFFAYQNSDLYYYADLDFHLSEQPPLSPNWASYSSIRGIVHRLSLGLFDLDLCIADRPFFWSDLEAHSLDKLFPSEKKMQSRISGLDLPKTRSETLVRAHSCQFL